jgi:hypothetical protein
MRAILAGLALSTLVVGACESGILKRGTDGPRRDVPPKPDAALDTGGTDVAAADQTRQDTPIGLDHGPGIDKPVVKDKPPTTIDKPVAKDKPPTIIDQTVKDKPPTTIDQTVVKDQPPATPDSGGTGPTIAGCPVFPATSPWNTEISGAAVDPNSAAIIAAINASGGQYVHPDFSSTAGWNPPYGAGIPYVVVPGTQPKVCTTFQYASESDPGPYPIPANPPIEGGPSSTGDRHILVIDKDNCKLYETFASSWNATQSCWTCGSGAIFDLKSTALRTDCWTSADAAGLPIFPGLVRYDEAVTAGEIRHALRVTFSKTRQAFLHPATHFASSDTNANLPPMGLRLRLKASYSIAAFTGAAKVVLVALQKYGMIVADNGSNWYISGAPHASWDDNNLNALKQVPGTAFEVVQMTGKLYTAADCP